MPAGGWANHGLKGPCFHHQQRGISQWWHRRRDEKGGRLGLVVSVQFASLGDFVSLWPRLTI